MQPKEEEERQEKTWENVPEDLKVEILCRLPMKDLIRFKSVSRNWYLLISSVCAPMLSAPSPRASLIGFIAETRYKRFRFVNIFRPVRGFKDGYESALPFKPEPVDFQDCCNGLLLFQRYTWDAAEYYICNPTTRECVRVLDVPKSPLYFTCLAFDPLVSPTAFKIIRRSSFVGQPRGFCLDIFSSDTGKWMRHILPIKNELSEQSFYWIHRSFYSNGTLYSMTRTKFLVCFGISSTGDDPADITCRIVPLPSKDKYEDCGSFGVVKGHVYYSNADAHEIRVWKLCKGDCWIIKHTISIDELYANPNACWYQKEKPERVEVYAFLPNSEEVLIGTPYQVHSYDPTTKFMEMLYHSRRRLIFRGQHRVFPYLSCVITLKERRLFCE